MHGGAGLAAKVSLTSSKALAPNLTAAGQNARFNAELYVDTGLRCFQVRLSCDDGTNLTAAGTEGSLLAQLFATAGRECFGYSTAVVAGGYRARLVCDDVAGFIDGVGSTLTVAAQNARLLATMA